jgi:pimeloyl-ACP methyl ester carboxylesterase
MRPALIGAGILLLLLVAAYSQLPGIGAGGLLHPSRRPVLMPPPLTCNDATFAGDEVHLKGWRCHAIGTRRGTLVYLHGIADNRTSAAGIVDRFGKRGFDVVAYDSRAHGQSDGDVCAYGFYEKRDLHRVLDTVAPGPIVLLGVSLGAAVALQEAAADRRVTTVVAISTFSDLRTVATERAPSLFTAGIINRAFALAEQQGRFQVDEVSPAISATKITQPVLLIHGSDDHETLPDHSRRILDALAGRKRLILVPGAGHNDALREDVWREIERWIDDVL